MVWKTEILALKSQQYRHNTLIAILSKLGTVKKERTVS